MPMIAVNIVKILFVVALYGYLLYIARAMRAYLAGPAPEARRSPAAPDRRPSPGGGLPPPAPPPAALEVITGDESPRLVEVTGRLVIGRGAAADIHIDDEFCSALHAAFDIIDGVVWVEDLGSTNGTAVDGARIVGRTRLAAGSTVEVGSTTVTVR